MLFGEWWRQVTLWAGGVSLYTVRNSHRPRQGAGTGTKSKFEPGALQSRGSRKVPLNSNGQLCQSSAAQKST